MKRKTAWLCCISIMGANGRGALAAKRRKRFAEKEESSGWVEEHAGGGESLFLGGIAAVTAQVAHSATLLKGAVSPFCGR